MKGIIIIGKNCDQDKIDELHRVLAETGQTIEIVESEHVEHGTVRLIEDCRGLDLNVGSMIEGMKLPDESYNGYDELKSGKRRTKKEWE
jgi:hypothetical protein